MMRETLIADVADNVFDYVIAGGGTAGLTLAARLSEDPAISVAVLEAGQAHIDDPNIVVLGQFGKTIGDPEYDWCFPIVKQRHSDDRTFSWARGKVLGGSSGINFYVWSKPPAADMDAIEKLGNPGWNWENYAKYSKRSETFHEPTQEQLDTYPLTFDPENHGHNGPIQTSFPRLIHTIDEPFQKTMLNMGLKAIHDPYGGEITGTWIASGNLDPETHTRSYATTAHYLPNQHRPNLTVLTGATVTRILFATRSSSNEDLVATGLEFICDPDPSCVNVVHAREEVILSAGAINDPKLLELSGIGCKEILDRIGVDVKVELPGVGENVQEHCLLGVSFELNNAVQHETFDMMHNPDYAALQWQLYAEFKGLHVSGETSFAYFPLQLANPEEAHSLITKARREMEELKASGTLPPGLSEQFDLQFQALKDPILLDLEIIAFPGFYTPFTTPDPNKKYVTIWVVSNHPLSRGTIHAVSKDPFQHPEIDPHYFENDFDLELLVQHVKFVKSMAHVEPWKSTVVREMDPGPEYTTDEEIRNYIKKAIGTCWHTVGSCSMLPRDKNGVVDPELKVYGTKNLRVVDISIIPLHIAAHTQATAYAIAEKAVDIIRGHK